MMRHQLTFTVALIAMGCGGGTGGNGGTGGAGGHIADAAVDARPDGSGGSGGSGGVGGSGGSGGSGGTGGSGGVGGSGGTGGTGGSGGIGGSGGSSGQCGGFPGLVCPSSQYWCDFLNNQCGGDDMLGACRLRPQDCTGQPNDPVCACNGMIYMNECLANAAGFDLNAFGCAPPPGMFSCGYRFCSHGTQYCQRVVGGPIGGPASYQCLALPAGCGTNPTCACLAGQTCAMQCTQSSAGDLTVTCFAP